MLNEASLDLRLLIGKRRRPDDNALSKRQEGINNQVIKFASGRFFGGGVVLDACAGSKGSLSACREYGYYWVGNDISQIFVKGLKEKGAEQVVVSDIIHSPYPDNCFDMVLFIFSLHDILGTEEAIREAWRILKFSDEMERGGLIVISDPGPSKWVSDILFYSLFKKHPYFSSEVILTRKALQDIEAYFSRQNYSIDQYADFFMERVLGLKGDELKKKTEDGFDKYGANKGVVRFNCRTKRRLSFYFQEIVIESYFEYIGKCSNNLGLRLKRVGVMRAAENTSGEWIVTEPEEISNKSDWLNIFLNKRRCTPAEVQKEVESAVGQRYEKIITFPILLLQKTLER